MGAADRIQKIREVATQIQTHVQNVKGSDTPFDHQRMYYAVSSALLAIVGELEDIRRDLVRLEAERKYLQRRGWS